MIWSQAQAIIVPADIDNCGTMARMFVPNIRADVRAEHRPQVIDQRLRRGRVAPRRVQDEVEPVLPIQLVDRRHEAVLVVVVDDERLLGLESGFGKPRRVVEDCVPPSMGRQLGEVLPPDDVVRAAGLLKLRENV